MPHDGSCHQDTLTLGRMQALLASVVPDSVSSPPLRTRLCAQFADFYLCDALTTDDFPLHAVFQELSTQVRWQLQTLLGCLAAARTSAHSVACLLRPSRVSSRSSSSVGR